MCSVTLQWLGWGMVQYTNVNNSIKVWIVIHQYFFIPLKYACLKPGQIFLTNIVTLMNLNCVFSPEVPGLFLLTTNNSIFIYFSWLEARLAGGQLVWQHRSLWLFFISLRVDHMLSVTFLHLKCETTLLMLKTIIKIGKKIE